jgi:sterol desaturase/sphingolipid hydroxylase (fatty acid hydroxylase superfamily)
VGHDYIDPTLFAIPLFIATMFWEAAVTRRRRREGEDVIGYEAADTRTSIGMGLVSIFTVALINLGVFALATVLWRYRIVDLGTGAVGWIAAIIGWDFAYYWTHRWEHEIRIFWAAHVNHHSSQHFNLSTALRQPWTPFLMLLTFPPLALLGIAPWMIMVSGGFNLIYQYWVHTEAIDRMPRWFEAVLNTPSHHRVHHGSNPEYIDRNYAGIFIVWDRLFGTFEPERARVVYGLTENLDSHNLLVVAFHEYAAIGHDVAAATRGRDRLGYVFGGPKWAPSPAAEQLEGGARR